jgi:hypothetical protein
MRRIKAISLLLLLFMVPSCSFLSTSEESSSSSVAPEGDQGYLKIARRHSSRYYTTDYLFVSEEGYEFTAEGKTADGKRASYTNSAIWESSDKSVFVVNNMGQVKAISNGVATLKATYNQYHDEIEVKVATYAETHETKETETYYRTHRTYEMPYHVEPANALVEYSFSIEDSIELIDNFTFIPKKSGEISVTATVYVNEFGLPRSDTFTLNVIENEKPYFIFDEKEANELELDVAVHKYQAMDWSELGISAFAGDDDSDITSNISVKEGTYDLNAVGEYHLVLSATNKGVEATIPFTLHIIEKEPVLTRYSNLNIETEGLSWTMAGDHKSITFSATAVLPDGYEDYWGEIGFSVQCEVKRKVSGQKVTLSKYSSRFIDKTPEKRFRVTATCLMETGYEMREGEDNVIIDWARSSWSGIGYNYIIYPAP